MRTEEVNLMHEVDKSFGPLDAGALQVAHMLLREDAGKSVGYENFTMADVETKADMVVKLAHIVADRWRRRR